MAREKTFSLLSHDDAAAALAAGDYVTKIDADNDNNAHSAVDLGAHMANTIGIDDRAIRRLFRVEFRQAGAVGNADNKLVITLQQSSDNSNWPADVDESTADNLGHIVWTDDAGMDQKDMESESEASVNARVVYIAPTKRYVRAFLTLTGTTPSFDNCSLFLEPEALHLLS
jgi:hypothetical protein